MPRTKNILIFICFLVIYYCLIYLVVLSSVDKCKVVVETSQKDELSIYYSNGFPGNPFIEGRSFKAQLLAGGGKVEKYFSFRDAIVRYFRIDPLTGVGSVKIYSIELTSHLGSSILLSPKDIYNNFNYGKDITLILNDQYLEVHSSNVDPQLVFNGKIHFENPLFEYVLPFFLSIISTLIVTSFSFKKIPAFVDISEKSPSSTKNIIALDGIRGFAALLVIADHTGYAYFKGLGAIGVWIFFCLSGFLLSTPFVKNPSLIKSPKYLKTYFLRRFTRIVPMYYFMLTILYILRGRPEDFIRHALFVQGDSIFWSVPQEMFFYMILPFLFITNCFVFRSKNKIIISFIIGIILLVNLYPQYEWLYVYGNGRKLTLWIGIFLTGVCLSYFYHSPLINGLKKRSPQISNFGGVAVIIIIFLSSNTVLEKLFSHKSYYTWEYTGLYGIISGLLIIFTITHSKCLLNRLMSVYPLRAIGIVGFSFYLIHPNVLAAVKSIFYTITGKHVYDVSLLIIATIVTYFLSVISYSLIEKPFLKKLD